MIKSPFYLKQRNFRMADVSNWKINKRSNVKRPILGVTKIENKNREVEASKFIHIEAKI